MYTYMKYILRIYIYHIYIIHLHIIKYANPCPQAVHTWGMCIQIAVTLKWSVVLARNELMLGHPNGHPNCEKIPMWILSKALHVMPAPNLSRVIL